LPKVRVRQHVNPLSSKYQQNIILPNWDQIYHNLKQPLHLDIGCARGQFLLQMAQIQPNINFLGLEIREPLVTEANLQRDQLGLTNLHFLFSNVNISLNNLLESLPQGVLHYITIQFPDPWFKHKHIKRRVVNADLVNILAQYLIKEGIVFIQSDVELIALEISKRFQSNPNFEKKHQEIWLNHNPFSIATEREKATINQDKPVYRALFSKI
jgi:tRNA (guanine-N7-)-methyltransferase